MNIIAVDDERPMLRNLEKAIVEALPNCSLTAFSVAENALAHAREHPPDMAFLDIRMPGISGLELAKKFKDIHPKTNIVFVTGYSEYAIDALSMHVSGYIRKPVTAEAVAREIENLRHPVNPPNKGLRAQCFGSFEIFCNEKPIPFRYTKTKELLAYLIDRKGARVSNKELAAVLWENEPYNRNRQKQLQKLAADLIKSLKVVEGDGLLVRTLGQYAVDVSVLNCDYYSYLKGDITAVNSYHGEYMANYSWAEFTAGQIIKN